MTLIDTIKERRSIRQFKDQMVERELLEEIISASKYAPTWNHFQIVRYNIIENQELIQKIADQAMLGFNHNINILKKAPSLLVISYETGKSGRFPGIQKESTEWEMFDTGCAAQTFALAAHDRGVGSVILGAFDEEKIASFIGLSSTERIGTLMPFGFAENTPDAPPRKENEEVIRYI